MDVRVTWEIDIFPEDLPEETQNLPEEKQILEYAKYVQERYFKGTEDLWVFTICIGGKKYKVDVETEQVFKSMS